MSVTHTHDFTVYVPVPGSYLARTIDPGSGIVGSPKMRVGNTGLVDTDDGRILIDYEGNRYGACNIVTYADRIHHAAGRQGANYPTTARCLADPEDLIAVGSYAYDYGRFAPAGGWELVQVAKWLALAVDDAKAAKLVKRWEDGNIRSIDDGNVLATEFAATNVRAQVARGEVPPPHNAAARGWVLPA